MKSSKVIGLKLQSFLILVIKTITIKDTLTLLSGVLSEDEESLPSPEGTRKVDFYLSNQDMPKLGSPGSMLYCTDSTVYMNDSTFVISVSSAVLLGKTKTKEDKPKASCSQPQTDDSIEKLPFQALKMNDSDTPPWEIPPRK